MKLEFTSHAVERSLERTGMTGVELNNIIQNKISRNKNIANKIFKKGIHFYWIKGTGIRLTLNGNILITVWQKP